MEEGHVVDFVNLRTELRYRVIERSLRRWFGRRQAGLADAAVRALRASKQGAELAGEIRAAVKRPVAYGRGLFHSAEAEVLRARRSGRQIDMDFVGDFSSSYEMVLTGPTSSPGRLEPVMQRRRESSAVMFELWVSHLWPVYVYDIYRKKYRRSDRSWYFEPVETERIPGRRIVQRVADVLSERGFIEISRRFCAKPVPTTSIRSHTGRPRVFDCLFTTTAGATRLEFDERGFRTARLRVGSNWPAGACGPVEGVIDKAFPAMRVSWRDRHEGRGQLDQRILTCGFPGGDTLAIELKGGTRVLSLRVGAAMVWTRPGRS